MVQGETIIEFLTEELNGITLDNTYTVGYKDGLKKAIELLKIAETVFPFRETEVSHA